MGTSRKFVDRLQRGISRSETKPAPPSAEPAVPDVPEPAVPPVQSVLPVPPDRRPRDELRPEQLTTLREIVREEQLLPFKKYRAAADTAGAAAPTTPGAPEPPELPAVPAAPPVEDIRHEIPAASTNSPTAAQIWKEDHVSNIDTVLKEAMQIDGAIGVALVDYTSGMSLGQAGGGAINLDVAAAGNTEVVRAKLRTMEALGMSDGIEDILITLSSQYHLIRLINGKAGMGLFLYLALDKGKANLALARHKLHNLETQLEV